MLDTTLRWAWALLKQRHREAPRFAVIAYGKLGGKELGYGSDLDVVFLYDDSDEDDKDRAQEVYGNYVRKLITWLTLRTAAGELFDIDTALRPNGGSGLLVTSIEAFERYQARPRQQHRLDLGAPGHHPRALLRRCASDLAGRFESGAPRRADRAARGRGVARRDPRRCARRCRAAHPVRAGRFDVKHSPGGMMDVEFAVQYLVLAQGAVNSLGCSTTSATSRCCSAPRTPVCCQPVSVTTRPTPTASCAARSTWRGWTNSRPTSSRKRWPRTAPPCSRCGAPSLADTRLRSIASA